MSKLIEFNTEDGNVLISVPGPGGMVSPTGLLEDSIETVEQSLHSALGVVTAIGRNFRGVIKEAGADSAELELSLQFTAKGSIYVVQAESNAAFKVKLIFSPSSDIVASEPIQS